MYTVYKYKKTKGTQRSPTNHTPPQQQFASVAFADDAGKQQANLSLFSNKNDPLLNSLVVWRHSFLSRHRVIAISAVPGQCIQFEDFLYSIFYLFFCCVFVNFCDFFLPIFWKTIRIFKKLWTKCLNWKRLKRFWSPWRRFNSTELGVSFWKYVVCEKIQHFLKKVFFWRLCNQPTISFVARLPRIFFCCRSFLLK